MLRHERSAEPLADQVAQLRALGVGVWHRLTQKLLRRRAHPHAPRVALERRGLEEGVPGRVAAGASGGHGFRSRELLDEGRAGENVGVLLRGIERTDVERGQILCKPGSVTPHKKFMGEVYVLKKEEGGRHTPFFTNYRPQFYMRTTDVTGTCELPEGTKMVMPGDNVTMTISLITPVGLEEQMRFAIREGGRTVGAGIVTKILA